MDTMWVKKDGLFEYQKNFLSPEERRAALERIVQTILITNDLKKFLQL